MTVSGRRYDKNADQLCQIRAHLSQKSHHHNDVAENIRKNMITMIDAMLIANDELGKMAEKGLI